MNLTREEISRRYRRRHPDRVRDSQRRYEAKNRGKILQRQQIYRDKNRERLRIIKKDYMKRFREENPELYAERMRPHNQRYRAMKRGAVVGEVDIALLIESWDRNCGICRGFVYDSYDIDHIIPLSKGGEHSQNNLQLTHSSCNRSKGNRI